ncbi:hypothetical protein [Montanilutibacter psychrotolerans]|uniref:DUF2502 domain-containing protein n=1 Tax=Montanilutibacter psychrotolerans TaxID=1327343 RepID=A0A3M8SZW1_9GAMM|nr:hypothetical protein [Lysobacter psychrotolerans]RNF84420.1 hypothetical protein EER27_08575 [Lysobacter psychrotolerans]
MTRFHRMLAPAALAAGLVIAALLPTPVQAQSGSDLVRVIVDVADVVYHSGHPYYRHGNYGYGDRLIVVRDRYGHRRYYRHVPRGYRQGPPYGNAYGYYGREAPRMQQRTRCDSRGRCRVEYYDPRHDNRYDNRYYNRDDDHGRYDRYDGRYDRYRGGASYYDGRRWRERDDD